MMPVILHILGGAGRIGRALVDSLVSEPLAGLSKIQVYCDSTKSTSVQALYATSIRPQVKVNGYSAFNIISTASQDKGEVPEIAKHVVLNLRGINNKQQWLNQPLDCLELHTKSCHTIVDANLWMQPNTEIIHFSSLLCDLIEGPSSLDDMCEGQEAYRRPYVVSRLHQEMILSANAYQHSICTSFLRMPAVYGFDDDYLSPWVLNSLCKAKLSGKRVEPRHPGRIVYLTHRDSLVTWMRSVIEDSTQRQKEKTVNYFQPPMLRLSVLTLATLVKESPKPFSLEEFRQLSIELQGDVKASDHSLASHMGLLTDTISGLLGHG